MTRSSRPKIPVDVCRAILIESGHRCAVCGDPCPLERAHIIPWHKSKSHDAENLICLCASCHERADLEGWGEKTLREYKRNPWVLRQRTLPLVSAEAADVPSVPAIDNLTGPSPFIPWDDTDYFKGQITRQVLSDNPYFQLPQSFDPSRYYGSQAWVDLVLQGASADRPRPIEFIGLPGMGKSTLMRYLAHPMGALAQNKNALHPPFRSEPWLTFMVLAEFKLCPSTTHPFVYLHDRFFEEYEEYRQLQRTKFDHLPDLLPCGDPLTPDSAIGAISEAHTRLKRFDVRVVLLLDDFHLAFAVLNFSDTTKLRPWRDRAAFIISTERRLIQVNAASASSPFFQTLPIVPFSGLTTDEARHLLRDPASRAHWPFAPDDIEFALAHAGTHPHLLIGAGAVLWEVRNKLGVPKSKKSPISKEHQQLLRGHFKERFLPTFQMYLEHLAPSERRALNAVVNGDHLEQHYPALAYLEKLGLVQLVSQDEVGYRPFSAAFGEYLREPKR